MTISAPSSILLAGSAFLMASSKFQRSRASDVWNPPNNAKSEDGVAAKTVDKHDALLYDSVLTKQEDPKMSRRTPEYMAVSFEEAMTQTTSSNRFRRRRSQGAARASGDLDVVSNKLGDKKDFMRFRGTYGPHHYDPATDSDEALMERGLQEFNGSPYSCIEDEITSCTGTDACKISPYFHVEPFACTGPASCSYSREITVGSGSCTGGSRSVTLSCAASPLAWIGQRSCQADSSGFTGACSYSSGIHVSDDACVGGIACGVSSQATIEKKSCRGAQACTSSSNITVDKYSCRHDKACEFSPNATIGKYSCNCPNCCRFLIESCVIPDFQCNGGDGDCSFSSGSKDCPF